MRTAVSALDKIIELAKAKESISSHYSYQDQDPWRIAVQKKADGVELA